MKLYAAPNLTKASEWYFFVIMLLLRMNEVLQFFQSDESTTIFVFSKALFALGSESVKRILLSTLSGFK